MDIRKKWEADTMGNFARGESWGGKVINRGGFWDGEKLWEEVREVG